MKDYKEIKSDEIEIGIFLVKYTLLEKELEHRGRTHKIHDIMVNDILIGDVSIKKDLNHYFNTAKSSFSNSLQREVEKIEDIYLGSVVGGLSGYYDD